MARALLVAPKTPLHIADGAAFSTFTTFQDVSPVPQIVFAQQDLEAGLDLRLEAHGEFSTTGTPTLSLGFWFNGAAGAAPTSILAQSSAITTASGAASFPWILRWRGRLRALGSTGSVQGAGELLLGTSLTAFATPVPIPITKALRTITVDTSASRALGVGAAYGTSSASNIVQVNYLCVDAT
jgi:hypothetical protein